MRPRKCKQISNIPNVTYFKPKDKRLKDIKEITLTFDELETLRHKGINEFDQKKAAKEMNIHQSTYHRTLNRAIKKVADALCKGYAIKIEGGEYNMPNKDGTGPDSNGPMTGRKLGNCNQNKEEIQDAPRRGQRGRGQRGFKRRFNN